MLYINRDDKTPIYEQIYNYFKKEILCGYLKYGDKLPATRRLAEELSVGRNTVNKAYDQLVAEGYISSLIGSGFIVNDIINEFLIYNHTNLDNFKPEVKINMLSMKYDFIYGAIDNSIFPHKQWRKCINNSLDQLEAADLIDYPERQGEIKFRQEISKYLKRSRGVICNASQVIITCGHQHSLEMLANMFENSNKRFAIEEPGYDGTRVIFENHKYEIIPVQVENDGISIGSLQNLKADLLYVTPSHQFPTGVVLPIGKRQKLLQWAVENNSYIIEDDYDSELRYSTNLIPSLQSLDINGRIIYAGTFSKSLSPTMRVAYLVLPNSLMDLYKQYYLRYNSQVSVLFQIALTQFISNGEYERHLNRLRTFYRNKQKALISAIHEIFGETATISGAGSGMHILLTVKSPYTHDEMIRQAEKIGVRVYSAIENYINQTDSPQSQILLGFATIPTNKFISILKELHHVWKVDK